MDDRAIGKLTAGRSRMDQFERRVFLGVACAGLAMAGVLLFWGCRRGGHDSESAAAAEVRPPAVVQTQPAVAGANGPRARSEMPVSTAPARRPVFSLGDNFHAIEARRAYRSGQLSGGTLRAAIQKYGIRTVINLRGSNPKEEWYRQEREVCEQAGVRMVDIRLKANAWPCRDELLLLFDTFRTASEPLLMHCAAGADRTGAAAAVWRMTVRGEPSAKAARELSARYGHIKALNPALDCLIEVFRPDRDWIETEYSEADGAPLARTEPVTPAAVPAR